MTIEDIKPLAVAPADAFLALKSGEVEAAYLLAPFYAQAVEDDLGVLVPETAPVYNNLGAGIFLGPKLLGEKADVGRAFVRAIARTTRLYLQGDYKGNDDVVSALADKLGVTVDDVRATEEMQWDPDLTMDAWPEQIEKVQELWRGLEGDILAYSDTLTADDMLAPEVMKAVLAGE
jgi:ABC-type nitrate/sulfonate/bicarbonate transport system substrate-binding protein